MVRSGFTDPKEHTPLSQNAVPRVSAYRLVTHLSTALTIYGGLIWTGMSILYPKKKISSLRVPILATLGLVLTTVLAGGFVAGNDAGCSYNTWPKMEGEWVPEKVRQAWSFSTNPRLFFEDTAVVQWNHRMLAYLSTFSCLGLAALTGFQYHFRSKKGIDRGTLLLLTGILPLGVLGQASLGVMTLLASVPVELGVAHQAGGVSLLTTLLVAAARLR